MKAKRMKKQNKNEKKVRKSITLLIIIIVIIALGTGILYYKPIDASIIFQNHNRNEMNLSEEFKKEKEFEGMVIKDITMKREDGITYFSANIENSTDKKFEEKDIKIIFQREDLSQMSILKTHLQNMEPGESVNIQLSTSANLMEAYTFKIV